MSEREITDALPLLRSFARGNHLTSASLKAIPYGELDEMARLIMEELGLKAPAPSRPLVRTLSGAKKARFPQNSLAK